jgi:hypothetical protein
MIKLAFALRHLAVSSQEVNAWMVIRACAFLCLSRQAELAKWLVGVHVQKKRAHLVFMRVVLFTLMVNSISANL